MPKGPNAPSQDTGNNKLDEILALIEESEEIEFPMIQLDITELTPDVAEILIAHTDNLQLDNLTHLDVPVAEVLARHENYLTLNGLTEISVPVAEALAKHESDLLLDGLKEISVPVAEALAKQGGFLVLGGLSQISESVAKALSSHRGDAITIGINRLDIPTARILSTYGGNLYLGLTHLDVPVAEVLTQHGVMLDLDRLTHLDIPVAEILIKCGSLDLSGLTHINTPLAEILTKHKNLPVPEQVTHATEKACELLNLDQCNITIIPDRVNIGSLKLPPNASEDINEWIPLFEEHPNFKSIVASEAGNINEQLKQEGVAHPECFHNLNAKCDVQPLIDEVFSFIESLMRPHGMEDFCANFKNIYLIDFNNDPEFIAVYKDEVVQAMADHLIATIEDKKKRLQKLSSDNVGKRQSFLKSKIDDPNLPEKVRKRFRRDLQNLLSGNSAEDITNIEREIANTTALLVKFENLHYLRPSKSGFKLAARNIRELTVGDECSDCTSASIAGMNFWTVPVWLTDPGFNFLLHYDGEGKLAHKFGFVWEISQSGEIILTIDSMELGNSQKEKPGMNEPPKSEDKEKQLMGEAIDFIYNWADLMGLDKNNIYATFQSNAGTDEFNEFLQRKFMVAKLGDLDAVHNIHRKYCPDEEPIKSRIYLQSLASHAADVNDPLTDTDEEGVDIHNIYRSVESVIAHYLQSESHETGDHEEVKSLLELAREEPREAARKMRIFLIMGANEETKNALSVDGERIDLYLANNGSNFENYFAVMLGKVEITRGSFATTELRHLAPGSKLE